MPGRDIDNRRGFMGGASMSDDGATVSDMWLYIDNDPLPQQVLKAREGELSETDPHEGFWLNLDTGSTIFLGPVRNPKDGMDRDQIRVYCLPPAADGSAIDVTTALTGKKWPYTDSKMNDTRIGPVRASLVAALTERLAEIS